MSELEVLRQNNLDLLPQRGSGHFLQRTFPHIVGVGHNDGLFLVWNENLMSGTFLARATIIF